jgi:hypothetical protein
MHSRFVSIAAIAVISSLPIFWKSNASAADWFDGQEILVECPVWEWEPSPISGVAYELCFDDTDHCTAVEIGDSVCVPSLGVHDVWITAIDYQGVEPIYYDSDIISVMRSVSSDFDGDRVVGFSDYGFFTQFFGSDSGGPADLDEDGVVGFSDFAQFGNAFMKCIDESGTIYKPCP